jgi:hypothetical protein
VGKPKVKGEEGFSFFHSLFFYFFYYIEGCIYFFVLGALEI